MRTCEKSLKESFSSTLLDEIYRSIDKKEGEIIANGNGVSKKINNLTGDEEIRRACFNGDFEKDLQQDNDFLFFSSSSISSDSSSGGLCSSDSEFFASEKTRKSCFVSPWPKPIKTKVCSSQRGSISIHQECQNQENLIRSRSRAMRIYANLKNVKQPISPGGRLTSFISSIFTHGSNPKKSKSCNDERKSKSTQTSASSSTTSFSRSCLSKSSHYSTGKIKNHHENAKRTVSFYVDHEDNLESRRTPLSKEMKIEDIQSSRVGLNAYNHHKKDDFFVERSSFEDEEDAASDCSSDLFEIDHLVLFRNDRFCEELPVYETTHMNKNLAIANGFVR